MSLFGSIIIAHMPITDVIFSLLSEYFIFLADYVLLLIANLLNTMIIIIRMFDLMAVALAYLAKSALLCTI